MKTLEERFWSKVKKTESCWEWMASRRPNGYGQVGVWRAGGWDVTYAHRVAWELSVGEIPAGLWILHRCDNKRCVRPDHLFLGDAQANMDDCRSKQRLPLGSACKSAKLTESKILEIRRATACQGELAQQYGVSQSLISMIRTKKRWAHV